MFARDVDTDGILRNRHVAAQGHDPALVEQDCPVLNLRTCHRVQDAAHQGDRPALRRSGYLLRSRGGREEKKDAGKN